MTGRAEPKIRRIERRRQLRKARIEVLQSLYAMEYVPEKTDVEGLLFASDHDRTDPSRELKNRLWTGIRENRPHIDEVIRSLSAQWSLERMSRVDRNILRIGTYEILYEESIPFRVSIDESLELAHQFSDPEAVSFINGILHQVGVRWNPDKVATASPENPEPRRQNQGADHEAG